jgi:hypothetical protein
VSRTLKRPMFRRGGQVNDGIMTGLTDRKQYSIGGIDREQLGTDAKTISDILAEFAPIPKTRLPIGQFGLDIATGTPVGEALKSGYKTFTTQDDMRRAAMAKRKQGAVSTALSSQMAEQKFKMQQMLKDSRIALEQKVDYVKKIMGFETNKEALEYINTSLSDVSKLTPETRIGQKLKSMPVQNRNKAEYLTFLEPYIPAAKRSGTYIISDKNSFPKKPIKNKTYFDISTGTLYEFIGGEPRDITSYQDVTAKYNKENFTFK